MYAPFVSTGVGDYDNRVEVTRYLVHRPGEKKKGGKIGIEKRKKISERMVKVERAEGR